MAIIRSQYFTEQELKFSKLHLIFDVLDYRARRIGEGTFLRWRPPHPDGDKPHGRVLVAAECWYDLFEYRSLQIPVDYGVGLFGLFTEEWQEDYGIEPFEPGHRYIGGAYDAEYGKVAYVFSREEAFGWMRLMMGRVINVFPDQEADFLAIERKYYDPGDVDGLIDAKLAGGKEWDHGHYHAVNVE